MNSLINRVTQVFGRADSGPVSIGIVWICTSLFIVGSTLHWLHVVSWEQSLAIFGLSGSGLFDHGRLFQLVTSPFLHGSLKAFDSVRTLSLIETQAEHLLKVLEVGTVSTNVHLRKLHNFCLDMNWLPRPVIPKRQWPPVRFKDKRAITFDEHSAIVERETNPERRDFYELLWHTGASQSDAACLTVEEVDWSNRTISYSRKKLLSRSGTGIKPALIRFGNEVEAILKRRPQRGALFPYLRTVRAGDRATEFKQRCEGLGIKGVTLHSYRYAWAERALKCGYPERFAQQALGHNSKAVHHAYAKHAEVTVPSLDDWEKAWQKNPQGTAKPKVVALDFRFRAA